MNKPEFFARAPEWMRDAYYNEPAVHGAVTHGMVTGLSVETIAFHVAGQLYAEMKNWREMALDRARTTPPPIVITTGKL